MPCQDVSVLIHSLFKVIHCHGTKQQLCQACFYQEGQEVEEGGCGEGMKILVCLVRQVCNPRSSFAGVLTSLAVLGNVSVLLPSSPFTPSDKVMRCKSLVCLTSCCPTARELGVLRGWERRLINAKRHSLMWQ